MLALLEQEAINRFRQQFPNDIANMEKINALFVLHKYREKDREELQNFADRFWTESWCDEHDVARAFARIGCFIIALRYH